MLRNNEKYLVDSVFPWKRKGELFSLLSEGDTAASADGR